MESAGNIPPTRHKRRGVWFQQRTSYPARECYPRDLGAPRAAGGPQWDEVGPLESGGRLTAMVVDPQNPDRLFVGSAGGGVWTTTDAGLHWTRCWSDQEATLSIGSLAMDPRSPDILYAGTGEANLSGDHYPGVGLYKTTDGGGIWSLIGGAQVPPEDLSFGDHRSLARGLPRRIGTVAVDPFDSGHILVGGITHTEHEQAGLFETRDGGSTWSRACDANNRFAPRGCNIPAGIFISALNYYCHSVVFHPGHKGLLFAAVEARGTLSGIWRSRDGGRSWQQAKKGLPPGDAFGRTSLAVAGQSKTIYALAGDQRTHALLGVFCSDNLGETWRQCGRSLAETGRHLLSYANCIAADPLDPMNVVVGSLNLHRSTDGGHSWHGISADIPIGCRKYLHRDQHAVQIIQDRIYSANDGGFGIQEGKGQRWVTRNSGLAVSMFYDIDVSPRNSGCLGGGMQDLGTWFMGPLDRRKDLRGEQKRPPIEFRPVLPGDGGWTCYDPDDATHVYACCQNMQLAEHRSDVDWRPLNLRIEEAEAQGIWMAIVTMDTSPSVRKRSKPRAIYIGSTRVLRSLNGGGTWKPVSDHLDGSPITAIEVAPADSKYVYVGTENGGFFRSTDAGDTWSLNLAGPMSPGRTITRIETPPDDARTVLYTIGLIADPAIQSFPHVYRSNDAGDNWFCEVDGLPNLPHNAIVVIPGGITFVAHDGGVQMSKGDGFRTITGNLPNSRITDLVYHHADRLLFASTYGRGVWRISIDGALRAWEAGETTTPW